MSKWKRVWIKGSVLSVALALSSVLVCSQPAPSKPSSSGAALSGIVRSDTEGSMEGVLVSAKRVGGTITITVVSDSKGRYRFPKAKLPPGTYSLTVRAVGYQMPPHRATVTGASTVNLTLQPAENLEEQLSSAEWLMSVHGDQEQKSGLYSCLACHSLRYVFESNYNPNGNRKLIGEMRNESPSSNIGFSSKLPYFQAARPNDLRFARYLSWINLSEGRAHWNFDLKKLPRPSGKSTHVVITEYDLPRKETMPGFAVMGPDGMIWFSDFRTSTVGRLNPKTGKVKEFPLPLVKPGFEPGSLCLRLDHKGNVWIARSFQGAVARFDPKTETVSTWSEPKEYRNIHSRASYLAPTPQGNVWFSDTFNRTLNLLDPKTGVVKAWPAFPGWTWSWDFDSGSGGHGKTPIGHFPYSVASDSRGWGYFSDEAGGNIGQIDPDGNVTLYPVPTQNAGPRLMHIDDQDRLWFGEDHSAKIGMFDTKTKEFKEYLDPLRTDDDYDAVPDREGFVWTGGIVSDLVTRLDPKTGDMTEFLLPQVDANLRALDIDNLTSPPSLLVGENHHAKIAIVTPLN